MIPVSSFFSYPFCLSQDVTRRTHTSFIVGTDTSNVIESAGSQGPVVEQLVLYGEINFGNFPKDLVFLPTYHLGKEWSF